MAVQQTLSLTKLSQDPATNTSEVRILWRSTQTGQSYNLIERQALCTVTVGQEVREFTPTYQLHKASTDTILDETVTVQHDEMGLCTVTVTTWMDTRISAGVVEQEKTLTLDPIPRASTVTAADGAIGGRATVVIGAHSQGFAHSLRWEFCGLEGWVDGAGDLVEEETVFTARTLNMVLPESFYGQLPEAPAGSCALICTTWQADRQVGSSRCSFTVTADPARCSPTLEGWVEDICPETLALTGDPGVLVRGVSTARCTARVTPGPGAAITEVRVGNRVLQNGAADVTGVQSGQFQFRVTDSRGYTGTCRVELPLIDYRTLTVNGSVTRTDPTSGEARLVLEGNFYEGTIGQTENRLQLTYSVNGGPEMAASPNLSGGTYRVGILLGGLDYDRSHSIRITARDTLMAVMRDLHLQPGIPVFDWGREDFRFHVPVAMPSLTLGGSALNDQVIAWGQEGDWVWCRWASGRAECWCSCNWHTTGITTPWGGFYAADDPSPRLEYPLVFWDDPVEIASMRYGGKAVCYCQDRNSQTQTGLYGIALEDPVDIEQTVGIQYYVTGFWKDPVGGEGQ